uniref:UvrD-helicase domain-containing protein n=1 Tax=Vibrio vulnificus TaxID=672 RepID=UPI0019D447D2
AWAAHQEERPDLAPHLLLHALGEVGHELEIEKQRRAEIGFDDLLSRLDRALQGPGGERLAQLIREQFPVALIDEFQDVSPQIVLWLQALHRRLATQGTAPSLMAIGDDWQS